ncbi:NUDIX domain-containing protein [Salinarimonas ramus]|nr:NUDIX domain-containing protein [Salinarimonas ramus]
MAQRDLDQMLPRIPRTLLHLVWRVTRGMTLGVRGIVRDEAGRVLLVRHTYTPGWHFPGGGVEAGETPLEALARELVEETGVTYGERPRLHGIFFNRAVSNRDHVLVYLVEAAARDDGARRAREIAEARYFDVSDLPEDVTPGTRRRIAEIVSGAPVGERW